MMEVKSGRELRRADLVERFGVSTSTARRDLRALIEGGDVEFLGPTKTGYYRLKRGCGYAVRRARSATVARYGSGGPMNASTNRSTAGTRGSNKCQLPRLSPRSSPSATASKGFVVGGPAWLRCDRLVVDPFHARISTRRGLGRMLAKRSAGVVGTASPDVRWMFASTVLRAPAAGGDPSGWYALVHE